MKHPMAALTIATTLALAVGAGSVAAQTPTQATAHATGAVPGPVWNWEAAVGPALLFFTHWPETLRGVELHATRYWGEGPVRTGMELSAAHLPAESLARITLGFVEQRPVVGRLNFTAHLGVGAFWYRDSDTVYVGFAPCHPELGCPSGGSRSPEMIMLPLAYAGAGLGLAVTDRVLLRGGGRAAVVRGKDDGLTLFELPVAFVVRF
jgi:hypothetical protein